MNHDGVEVLFIENRGDKRSERDSPRKRYGEMEVQELQQFLTTRSPLTGCTSIIETR